MGRSKGLKTLGIVGGIGPESTIEYYRLIVAAFRTISRSPPVIINSIDMRAMLGMVEAGNLPDLTRYLAGQVKKLADAGADLGILAANTPHIVFEDLRQQVSIPLISIVETACMAARALKLKKPGLFGTRFTMKAGFYQDAFSRHGIALVAPAEMEQAFIHEKYMSELTNGVFLDATRARLLQIVDRLRADEGIDGLILGGTELPLIMRRDGHEGIPFLDTAKIHVEHAVAQLIA